MVTALWDHLMHYLKINLQSSHCLKFLCVYILAGWVTIHYLHHMLLLFSGAYWPFPYELCWKSHQSWQNFPTNLRLNWWTLCKWPLSNRIKLTKRWWFYITVSSTPSDPHIQECNYLSNTSILSYYLLYWK